MKTVLIVGGSSGIGNACVRVFKKNNWNILATYFSNKKRTDSSAVTWSFLDITDIKCLELFIKEIPKLDALIICAAKNKTEKSDSFDEEIDLIFDTNVISQIKIVSLLKGKLRKKSSIILFSSITGRVGSKRRIAYSSSKSAIYGLVKSLAASLAPDTRVNAVCPGYIDTPQYVRNSTITVEERKKSILLDRLGTSDEVANLVYFLSSENASYINGQSINIDGGVI